MALNDYNDFIQFPLTPTSGRRVVSSGPMSPRREEIEGPAALGIAVIWRFSRDADLQGLITEFESVGYTRPIAWTPPGFAAGQFVFRAPLSFRTARDSPRYVVTATLDRFNGA
jgi:hypothetical protein